MLHMNLPIYCIALLMLSAIVSAPHSVTIKATTNFSDSESNEGLCNIVPQKEQRKPSKVKNKKSS